MRKNKISSGELGEDHAKGSSAQKFGDGRHCGDKDTSGLALNIVMRLAAILNFVFGSTIALLSLSEGGPFWTKVK